MKLTRLTAKRKGEAIQITGQFRGASGYRVRLRLADLEGETELAAAIKALLKKGLTVKEVRAIGKV
jgi:hypothetical protein